ncbi:MAG: N-acetylmuramoyl-L-alanine amidase [bacterium]|nr:N-acetylmuramoyl-L-alanine amidase [bacterium]
MSKVPTIQIDKHSLTFHNIDLKSPSDSDSDGEVLLRIVGNSFPENQFTCDLTNNTKGNLQAIIKGTKDTPSVITDEKGTRVLWSKQHNILRGVKIAIDAGHGGSSPGAVGVSGSLEKHLARAIVDRIVYLLRQSGAIVNDIRPNDQTVTLADRVRRVQASADKAFVSVHLNASEKAAAHGTETFTLATGREGKKLASAIQQELVRELKLFNRGVKTADFYLLRHIVSIPSVLVEVGFMSNPSEEMFLLREETQFLAAVAIVNGLASYFSKRQ